MTVKENAKELIEMFRSSDIDKSKRLATCCVTQIMQALSDVPWSSVSEVQYWSDVRNQINITNGNI